MLLCLKQTEPRTNPNSEQTRSLQFPLHVQERQQNHLTFRFTVSSAESPEHILAQLLQYIGENLKSDRAYIFEANLDGTFDNTYEWCREGVSPQIDNLKNVPYEGVLDTWFLEYEKRRNILIYDIEEYKSISENMYHVLKPQGIHTLVTGPIEINGKYIGLYGVDNPPKEFMENISVLIEMMEFVISMIIRLRDYSNALEESAIRDQLTHCPSLGI